MMHLQKTITAKRAIPLVLLLLFFNALIATFTCGPLVACRAYAATQPADADALGLTAQDSIPISAALSDDGMDYGWLYRKGNYWFRVSDYPRTEPRSQYAVMATDGECTFMMSDFMAQYGEPPDSNAQLHFFNVTQDFYSDGVLVFECVNSFRLDYMVAYGEQGVWWGHGASSVYNTAAGLGAPDSYPRIYSIYNGLNGVERDMRLDEVKHVIFDRSLFYRWGTGYYDAGCPGRYGQEVIYLDRWFEGCTNLESIEGFENIDTREVLTMARMFKGCAYLEELDIANFDTHACRDFADMLDGCVSLRSLKTGEGWTQAGAGSASGKATFPLDMAQLKDGAITVFRKGQVIPDGAAEYTALSHVNVQWCDVAFADAAAQGEPTFAKDFTCDYTGHEIEPLVRVSFNGEQLEQGVDYTVAFSNNVEDGVAHATITGIDTCFGQTVVDFQIQDLGAYAALYDDGTLYLKKNHHPMESESMVSPANMVMIAPWFNAEASNSGSTIPWANRAREIKRVVFDRSFSGFSPHTARGWFEGCTALRSVSGLKNLNASSLASMENLFRGCTSLASLSFAGVDLSKVTDMSGMLQGCTALTSLSLQDADLSQVTDMSCMLQGCTSLATVSLEGANLAQVTDASSMLQGCTALATVSLEGANLSQLANMSSMLQGCTSLTALSLQNADLAQVTNASSMLQGCTSLATVSLEGTDLSQATDMSEMFAGCTALENASLKGVKLASAQDMSNLFRGCTVLASISFENVSAPTVQTLRSAFEGCAKLTDLNLAGANIVVERDLGCAFKGCGELVNLDLSSLAAPRATDVSELFAGCPSLETLTLGDIGSSGGADLSTLLSGCPNLKTLATSPAWRNAASAASLLAFSARAYRVSPGYMRFEGGEAIPAGAGEYRLRDLALQFATVVMSKSSYTCTGKALKPAVKVKLGDVVLQNGKDYTLTYKNNVHPGKASITIQGKGALTGGLVVPFKIVARTTKVGDRLVYETKSVQYTFKVTKLNKNGKKVSSVNAELVGVKVKNKKLKTMSIPDQCTISGVKVNITAVTDKLVGPFRNVTCVAIGAKVVTIGVSAFAKAPKVKKLLVKSSRLQRVKNCLKGSNVRRVETRVYLSKTRKSTYKRWFTKLSGKSGVKFVYGLYFVVI